MGAREAVSILWGLARLKRDAVAGPALMQLQAAVAGGALAAPGGAVAAAPLSGLGRAESLLALLALSELPRPLIHVPFVEAALTGAAAHLEAYAPAELAQAAFALGRCRYRPAPNWARAFLDAAARGAGGMRHQELAMLLWGAARLQVGAPGRRGTEGRRHAGARG
jgi:hypothetical protein